MSSSPTTSIPMSTLLKSSAALKPKRALTAYHLYLQLEREYIIQTSEGEVADKSLFKLDQKEYLENVPHRYKNIRLLPNWYFKPDKRAKRKHRKSHGKIGFLELSQIIAKRWKTLSDEDPETLQFVQKIANIELSKYHQEMKEYKELIKCLDHAVAVEVPVVSSPPPASISIVPKNSNDTIIHSNTTPPAQRHVTPIYPPPIYTNMGEEKVIKTISTHSLTPFNFYNQEAPTTSLRPKAPFRRNISFCSDIDLEVDMNDNLILDLWRSCNKQEPA